MLPSKTDFKQSGSLPGESVKMSFDENSLGFLADVLINLYSDKEMAVIREYSTNARDSHIEAGIDRPIEVTTPSGLSFFLRIKDYGVGLSKEDIIKIYSKYGASTKRYTNKQGGMLGLGCKSALTYTDQFTIVAVKDGVKINVAVSRAVDGGGSMTILSETETTEPNGVEIVIPTQRNNNFARKCRKFFQYWEEGQVLVDGEIPQKARLTKITDRIHIRNDADWNDKPVLVMGGIAYEINQDQIDLPATFVAFVEIGAVAFQPNREYLHYTPETISVLNALKEEYKENLVKKVQADIDNQTTRLDAAKIFSQWRGKLHYSGITLSFADVTYKGESFKSGFKFDYKWHYGSGFVGVARRTFELANLGGDVIVYGFDADNITPYQKRKLNYWAENEGVSPRFFFCVDKPDIWLEDIKQLDWKDILALKIKRASSSTPTVKAKPVYDCYIKGYHRSADTFDDTKPILYSTKSYWKELTANGYRTDSAFPDVQFVFVGANREKKFLKAFPTAQKLGPGLKTLVQGVIDNLSEQEKLFLKSDKYDIARYGNVNKNRVEDPELIALIDASSDSDAIAKVQHNWNALCGMSWQIGIPDMYEMFTRESQTGWVHERYPLFSTLLGNAPYRAGASYWDHVYLYLNMVYKEYKNGV